MTRSPVELFAPGASRPNRAPNFFARTRALSTAACRRAPIVVSFDSLIVTPPVSTYAGCGSGASLVLGSAPILTRPYLVDMAPPAVATGISSSRLYYLDWIRVLALVAVFLVHALGGLPYMLPSFIPGEGRGLESLRLSGLVSSSWCLVRLRSSAWSGAPRSSTSVSGCFGWRFHSSSAEQSSSR